VPLYDYRCTACKEITEVRHGFDDVFREACPKCGGKLTRMFNPAGIVFKGSGFYVTDSRKAAAAAAEAKTETKTEAKAETKSESKSADTSVPKPESKSDTGSSGTKESAA